MFTLPPRLRGVHLAFPDTNSIAVHLPASAFKSAPESHQRLDGLDMAFACGP
jgi:hypothetical protein